MLQNFENNLNKLSLEVKNLKNQNINKNLSKNNFINNQKNEIIDLILSKFENNLDYSYELNFLEKNSTDETNSVFEKLYILDSKKYKGNLYLKEVFLSEINDYLQFKFSENSNRFIKKFIFSYIKIKPSKENTLKNNELIYINEIEKLIEKREYKKALEKLKLINKHDVYFVETFSQINIANEFIKLIMET